MLSTKQLAAMYGISSDAARNRLLRAGIKPIKQIKNCLYYPAKTAIPACVNHGVDLPPGTITLAELAELAERTKGCIAYRLRKAGIKPCGSIMRQIPGKQNSGGHPMNLYPQRAALAAALDKD